MESRIKVAGHPLHPMLIVFPLGLLATAVAFDIAALVQANNDWFHISFWIMGAGILGGLLAALTGLADWVAIPRNTRAKAIGLWHGGGNVGLGVGVDNGAHLECAEFTLRTPSDRRVRTADAARQLGESVAGLRK